MLILIGPSASGKTEIANYLSKYFDMKKIVTYTTRKIRAGEVNGISYNFVSLEEFADLSSNGFFVETTYYNANYYGTAKKDVTDDKCVILDPNGLKSFLKLNDSHVVSVYLNCNEEVRYQRMIGRKDGEESARNRILNDRIAFNDDNLKGITFVIDSDVKSVEELSLEVMNLYNSIIRTK